MPGADNQVTMNNPASTRGLTALTCALLLSQFFRTCLGVMAPEIQADLHLSPAGFGLLSSCFFLSFGIAQIPVGIAFDRYGVGGPTRVLMALGVFSAALFVCAPGGLTAMLAQAGLGLACAPIFMGLMHYAAEVLPPDRYVPFISRTNALGMLGALCATAPLGWVIEGIGWRPAMAIAALVFAFITASVWRSVKDQGQSLEHTESPAEMVRASLSLLAMPALWTIIPMCIAMAAGTSFRNAWGGPYLASVFALDIGTRGLALAVLSVGAFAAAGLMSGLVQRYAVRSTVLNWTLLTFFSAIALMIWPQAGVVTDVGLLALLATVGVLHPLVMSHARSLLKPSFRGRGLGLLNGFVFLGSAFASWVYGLIAADGLHRGLPDASIYSEIFTFSAALILIGGLAYAFSPRRGFER
ncbi:MFS transporter [Pseudomonas vanderleydeniana]|uniref:MFS transporter n=1 Tax=Pseudomonas vanderleydeniana TaxID=2745495 RepID=A0A9E6PR37_9PSED|nr:MFS transporter [Pseudomonas vanderleydeniana]QXI31129.1 MFS transporter [Pseudomonas vanderleydeniana]